MVRDLSNMYHQVQTYEGKTMHILQVKWKRVSACLLILPLGPALRLYFLYFYFCCYFPIKSLISPRFILEHGATYKFFCFLFWWGRCFSENGGDNGKAGGSGSGRGRRILSRLHPKCRAGAGESGNWSQDPDIITPAEMKSQMPNPGAPTLRTV